MTDVFKDPADAALADAVAVPPQIPGEGNIRSWLRHTRILAGRQLSVLFRDRATFIQIIFIPVITMILFNVVLGEAVGGATGRDPAYGTVPLVVLVSAMFGSLAAGIRLNMERRTGLLARLYVMPIHRAADLTSRLVCETARIALTTILLIVVGHFLGFRFDNPLAVVGIVGVALMFGIAYAMLVLAFAVNARPGAPLVPMLSLVSGVLMFFNSGFSPLEAYPTWLQPIVEYQPMTPAIEVMRAMAEGQPFGQDLVVVVAWALGLTAVFTVPALVGYRRAATSRA